MARLQLSKVRLALSVTSEIKKWINLLKSSLSNKGLTKDEIAVIYLKVAKGLYIESQKIGCPADYLNFELKNLQELING